MSVRCVKCDQFPPVLQRDRLGPTADGNGARSAPAAASCWWCLSLQQRFSIGVLLTVVLVVVLNQVGLPIKCASACCFQLPLKEHAGVNKERS